MSALAQVERLLERLCAVGHASSADGQGASADVVGMASQLKALCMEASEENVAPLTGLVFAVRTGVFGFLAGCAMNKDKALVQARTQVLKFVAEFMEMVGERVLREYAADIWLECYGIFTRDQSDVVRAAAFPPMYIVLDFDFKFLKAHTLHVAKVAGAFFRAFRTGKYTQTVRGNLNHMLGRLAERYPAQLSEMMPDMMAQYLRTLDEQFKLNCKEPQLVHGAFLGLEYLLVQHDFAAGTTQQMDTLFHVLDMAIHPPENAKRFNVPRAALGVLKRHMPLLNRYVVGKHRRVFSALVHLSQHINNDLRRAAFATLDAFLQEVAKELVKHDSAQSTEMLKDAFDYFVGYFMSLLHSETSSQRERSMAIRGLGMFSGPIRQFYEGDEGIKQLRWVMDRLFYFSSAMFQDSEDETADESINHLSSFIDAFASILHHLNQEDDVEDAILEPLEKLMGTLFKLWPRMFRVQRASCRLAVSRLFSALFTRGAVLETFLERFTFHALIVTVSTPLAVESAVTASGADAQAVMDMEAQQMRVEADKPFFEYLSLWRGLLHTDRPKGGIGIEENLQEAMDRVTYGVFVRSLLKLIERLDLRVAPPKDSQVAAAEAAPAAGELEAVVADPHQLRPLTPKDFDIFLNLVEFTTRLLPKTRSEYLLGWMYIFVAQVMEAANRFPLVSGFYKLLTTAMRVCKRYQFFDPVRSGAQDIDEQDMVIDHEGAAIRPGKEAAAQDGAREHVDDKDREMCHRLVGKFTGEVIVRSKQYKDELLVACLEFVLAVPFRVFSASPNDEAPEDMTFLVHPLASALRIGASHLALARVGVSTLENWLALHPNLLVHHLPEILPVLDIYLTRSSPGQEALLQDDAARKANILLRKHKEMASRDPYVHLQHRIIRLLGRMGGHNSELLAKTVGSTSDDAATGMRSLVDSDAGWDTSNQLMFELPFRDWKITVPLDALLPRVLELAENAGDRRTKVASCELLHSIVLFMVGTSAKDCTASGSRSRVVGSSKVFKLYARVVPVLLRLAVDVDPVPRQLFEPLVLQIVRWVTGTVRNDSREAITLLDAISEALGDANNGALREYAARCMTDFLTWAIKQSPADIANTPIAVSALLHRLFGLLRHPSPFRRIGATHVVDRTFRAFRNEPAVVDEFVLDILRNCLASVRLAGRDENGFGTVEHAYRAVRNVAKIVIVHCRKSDGLINESETRTETLQGFLEWLFGECGHGEIAYREACIWLFPVLCLNVKRVKNGDRFVRDVLDDEQRGPAYVVGLIENELRRAAIGHISADEDGDGAADADAMDVDSTPAAVMDVDIAQQDEWQYLPDLELWTRAQLGRWFRALDAALSGYMWLATSRFVDATQLGAFFQLPSSRFMTSLVHAIENFATIVERRALATSDDVGTPAEWFALVHDKSMAIGRLFQFLTVMIDLRLTALIEPLLTEKLFTCLYHVILDSALVGTLDSTALVLTSTSDAATLASVAAMLCTRVRRLPDVVRAASNVTLNAVLTRPEFDIRHGIDFAKDSFDPDAALKLVRGYQTFVASSGLTGATADSLARLLAQSVKALGEHSSPLRLRVGGEVLRLAMQMGLSAEDTIDLFKVDAETGADGTGMYRHFHFVVEQVVACNMTKYAGPFLEASTASPLVFNLLLNVFRSGGEPESAAAAASHRGDGVAFGTDVDCTDLLENWFERVVGPWLTGDNSAKERVLRLLTAMLGSKAPVLESGKPWYAFAIGMLAPLLGKDVPTSLRSNAVRLAPYFLEATASGGSTGSEALKAVVDQLNAIVTDFPVNSKDLVTASSAFLEFRSMMTAFLDALMISRSPALIDILLPVLAEEEHVMEEHVTLALVKFSRSLARDQARVVFDHMIERNFLDESLPTPVRVAVIDKVAVPLLWYAQDDLDMAASMINQHIVAIIGIVNDASTLTSNAGLWAKISAFKLLETMYSILPYETVIKGLVNRTYFEHVKPGQKGNGSEMTRSLLGSLRTLSRVLPAQAVADTQPATRRAFHQAAYSVLATILLETQTKENIFAGFLFKENPAKGELLWDNLIDTKAEYDFQVGTDFGMRSDAGPVAVTTKVPTLRKRYLSSVYLSDSSLSQDASYMGSFLGATTEQHREDVARDARERARIAASQASQLSQKMAESAKASAAASTVDSVAGVPTQTQAGRLTAGQDSLSGLELDEINQIPAMGTLLRIVDEVDAKFGRVLEGDQFVRPPPGSDMPEWMQMLHARMTDRYTIANVRIFIAKLVVNRVDMFAPYARHWMTPLAELACSSDNGGQGFHYFVRDLCNVLLAWTGEHAEPPASNVVSALVHHLMRHAAHQARNVLRSNLIIIKTILENWGLPDDLSLGSIRDHLGSDDLARRLTGVQLLGVVVVNGFEHMDMLLRDEDILRPLVRQLDQTKLYESTAEVLGLILREASKSPALHEYRDRVLEQLHYAVKKAETKQRFDRFLNILYKTSEHYPAFAKLFFMKILNTLPSASGKYKAIALHTMLRVSDEIPDLYTHLLPHLRKLLSTRDDDTQYVALAVLFKVLRTLDCAQANDIVGVLLDSFSDHPDPRCRKSFCECLVWLFDNAPEGTNKTAIKRELLRALVDDSADLRAVLFDFWDEETRMPSLPPSRLHELLTTCYDMEVEHAWLHYATKLMLRLTHASELYNEPMFSTKLCDYKDMFVDASSDRPGDVMTPMFSSTHIRQAELAEGGLQGDQVRATQKGTQYSFTFAAGTQNMTMDLGTYSVTGSSLLFSDSQQALTAPMPPKARGSDGDAAEDKQKARLANRLRIRFKIHPEGRRPDDAASTTSSHGTSASVAGIGDTPGDGTSWDVIKLMQRRRRIAEAYKKREKQSRAQKVQLYRSYRSGELPDINIPRNQLVTPLEAVVERDAVMARALFVVIYNGMRERLADSSEVADADAEASMRNVQYAFKDILGMAGDSRGHRSMAFVECIQKVCAEDSETYVPARDVGLSSMRTLNYHSGIMLLESQILRVGMDQDDGDEADAEGGRKKRRGGASRSARDEARLEIGDDERRESWSQLARLYAALKETDVVKSLYEKRIASDKHTRHALLCESRGLYADARMDYENALAAVDAAGPSEVEAARFKVPLWRQGAQEAARKLGDWDNVEAIIRKGADATELDSAQWHERLWDDPAVRNDAMVPYAETLFKRGDVRSLLEGKDGHRWKELQRLLDAAPSGTNMLDVFGHYWPLLLAIRNEGASLKLVSQAAIEYFDNFLIGWASIHPLSTASRYTKLQSLQLVTEAEEFANFASDPTHTQENPRFLQKLVDGWRHRYPSLGRDDITIWNDVLTARAVYLDFITQKFEDKTIREGMCQLVAEEKSWHILEGARAALQQRLFGLARDAFQRVHNDDLTDRRGSVLIFGLSTFIERAKARAVEVGEPATASPSHRARVMTPLDRALKWIAQTKDLVHIANDRGARAAYASYEATAHALAARWLAEDKTERRLEERRNAIAAFKRAVDETTKRTSSRRYDQGARDAGTFDPTQATYSASQVTPSLAVVDHAADSVGGGLLEATVDSTVFVQARLEFATYCDSLIPSRADGLAAVERELGLSGKSDASLPLMVVRNILEAMRLDTSGAARARLPRVLAMLARFPAVREEFEQEAAHVPAWMFLAWIPQLLGTLDSDEGVQVVSTLETIAREYPNAMFHPFQVTLASLATEAGKLRVQKLKQLLADKTQARFVQELENLTHPQHKFQDACVEIHSLLKKNTSASRTEAMRLARRLQRNVFDSKHAPGKFHEAFAKQFASKFVKLFGSNASALSKVSAHDFSTGYRGLLTKEFNKFKYDAKTMDDFSFWMASFDDSRAESQIEVPGQYTGARRPHVADHAKIVGFDSSVVVLVSMRKPKRIVIRGSDEREAFWLAKSGDDLRGDERVEQVFRAMNQLMARDPESRKRNLGIVTYRVIPMGLQVGLLEWVTGTATLNGVLDSQVIPGRGGGADVIRSQSDAFAKQVLGDPNDLNKAYIDAYTKYRATGVDALAQKLVEVEEKMPWDLLRSAVMSRAQTPVGYLSTRANFASSLAVFNICSYLLGIGDRHLGNTLMDANGTVVGIDFGHNFGSATTQLPVPELMPFRLTRQMVNLIRPLDADGLLKTTMCRVMELMRANDEYLLSIVDLFVREPLLDWKQNADRVWEKRKGAVAAATSKRVSASASRSGVPSTLDDTVDSKATSESALDERPWNPESRVELVRQKLMGRNPANIVADELRYNSVQNKEAVIKGMVAVARGHSGTVRAQYPDYCKQVKHQIDCLVDLATDKSVMARTWIGWRPFV